MKRSLAEKAMKMITAISAIGAILNILLYLVIGTGIWLSLAITFGTIFYHFIMRLFVGISFNKWLRSLLNYKSKWFSEWRYEADFYRRIKIRKWKNKLPTYYPENFSMKRHSIDEMIQTMCIAELGHETMIVLSYLPLFLSAWFGMFYIFLLTSILAGLADSIFVFVQRYNRNRLVKIAERGVDRA